ncbi:MAG: Nucleoside phosphorylase-like protein [Actinoallomurus sp.]|nr:Nucleoside phosphorylase-like protein [Actinoallomurus sp.]
MNELPRQNYGVISNGSGGISFQGNTAIGPNAHVQATPPPGERDSVDDASRRRTGSWDVGVITALSEETAAVTAMLRRHGDYHEETFPDGRRCHEARIAIDEADLGVVAIQAVQPGQRSAAVAFQRIRDTYAPAVIVLVGIAGGIHADLALGDVVIAQGVVYYDLRKETPHGVRRRGQNLQVPPAVVRCVNAFLADHPYPLRLTGRDPAGGERPFTVLTGPIGSGDAVVADDHSAIRDYLGTVNDKTLALETEAGGIAQAFYEQVSDENPVVGWSSIRGISDQADIVKDDSFHVIAAENAATVLERLLPYLAVVTGRGAPRRR